MTKRDVGIQGTCLAGVGFIVYAAYLAWPPLAFAVSGVGLCAFGVHMHRIGQKANNGAKQ